MLEITKHIKNNARNLVIIKKYILKAELNVDGNSETSMVYSLNSKYIYRFENSIKFG